MAYKIMIDYFCTMKVNYNSFICTTVSAYKEIAVNLQKQSQ